MNSPTTFSPDLLQVFDRPGPRYTSYPTADRFHVGFGPSDAALALAQRSNAAPLSVYVHVPFCESVCYYCACNKVITKHHELAAEYLDALVVELELVTALLGPDLSLSQMHFGGGSPTFLSDAELRFVFEMLRRAFRFTQDAEISIEVDPRTVTPARLSHLRALGFSRLSFGVQDFDPVVQQAVHRVQPFEDVRALMHSARELGFESINADLIYGLPCQTPESFHRTLRQIGSLRPDRIALYGYAHLPQRFKPQRRIETGALPDAVQRVAMLGDAIDGLTAAGYDYVGMDHFALHDDALAVARRSGRLHRNFQGYSTQADTDLVGLGVSAISRLGGNYYQNAKSLPEYYERVHSRELPVERGIASDADDLLRHDVIMALMCQGRLDFPAIERAHRIDMRSYFADELDRMRPLELAGLVVLEPTAIQVTPAGWFLVRAVAMVFDRHLRRDPVAGRFSRLV